MIPPLTIDLMPRSARPGQRRRSPARICWRFSAEALAEAALAQIDTAVGEARAALERGASEEAAEAMEALEIRALAKRGIADPYGDRH